MLPRGTQFAYVLIALLLFGVVAIGLLDQLTLDMFLLYSVVAYLLLAELTEPVTIELEWRDRLRWVTLVGYVGFLWLGVRQILVLLG